MTNTPREKHFAYFYKYLSGLGANQNLLAKVGKCAREEQEAREG